MRRRVPAPDALSLKQVLGQNVLHGNGIGSSQSSESLFYIAGSTVVRYSPLENAQKNFYSTEKALSCVAVSKDGRFIAAGERGHLPNVIVWDIAKQEKIATLTGHKHGIGALSFSNNGKYLVSVGFKPDKQLILWDWREERKLSTQKLVNKVHSVDFQEDDNFFVTAGDRHLKWWYLAEVLEGEAIAVEGKPASIIEEHRLSVFIDVICGRDQYDGLVYCTTASGLLCMFNADRSVEKWVQLESKASFSMELFTAPRAVGLLVVGCAAGVIRAFSPQSLEYIATLPLPSPLKVNTSAEKSQASAEAVFPACYSLTKVYPPLAMTAAGAEGYHIDNPQYTVPKLCATYSDRSMIIWDISDIYACSIYREMKFHHSCIWDVRFVQDAAATAALPPSSFVTCSADNSIRFWSTETARKRKAASSNSQVQLGSAWTKASSGGGRNGAVVAQQDHLLGTLNVEDPHGSHNHRGENSSFLSGHEPSVIASTATGLSMTNAKAVVEFDYAEGLPDYEIPDKPQSSYFPRTVALHPDGQQLACGDKSGKLRLYHLPSMHEIYQVQAHSAEILAVAFSPILISLDYGQTWSVDTTYGTADSAEAQGSEEGIQRMVLLATAGRDRLIHVFDCPISSDTMLTASQQYTCIETLDHHSASVTCVTFTSDGSKLISCGGDKTMVFYQIHGRQVTCCKTIQTPLGTVNGLTVDVSNKFVVTSGQDKRLNIWNLHSGKHMRAYKNAELNVELYKTDIDPSGSYLVTCGFDKSITLLDFFSGEVIAQVYGHSELVTNVAFSRDGSSIVTVGGDGVILVWKVAEFLVKAMQDRLMELYANAQRRNQKLAQKISQHSSHVAALGTPTAPPASGLGFDHHTNSSSVMPPAPPTQAMERAGDQVSNQDIASSLASLKLKQINNNTHGVTSSTSHSNSNSSTTTSSMAGTGATSAGKRVSRWRTGGASVLGHPSVAAVGQYQDDSSPGVDGEGSLTAAETDAALIAAYELHGRKIVADKSAAKAAQRNLNKFTLELTGNVLASEKTWRPTASNANNSSPSRNAVQMAEDDDMVLQVQTADDAGELSDLGSQVDDEDDEKLFRTNSDAVVDDTADVLAQTQTNLNSLEETLHGLEDWLESKLKSDAALDAATALPPRASSQEPDTTSASSAKKADRESNNTVDLNSSLSAAFFSQTRQSRAMSLSNPVASDGQGISTSNLAAESLESIKYDQRRRENVLQMSQVRDRMRAMGIAQGQHQEHQQAPVDSSDVKGLTITSNTLPPPPPPLSASGNVPDVEDDEEIYDTPSTVSHDDHDHEEEKRSKGASDVSALALQLQLKNKQEHYLAVLRDLDAAKERAMQSFQELVTLRSSLLEVSMSASSMAAGASHGGETGAASMSMNLDESAVIADEAEHLLAQYRRSLTSFASAGLDRHQHRQHPSTSSSSVEASLEESILSHLLTPARAKKASKAHHQHQQQQPGPPHSLPTHLESTNNTVASDLSGVSEANINAILERYSDRLVDIVGEKIVSKLAASHQTPHKR